MNTAETIAISLIVPFLTGLSWLTYKHFHFYNKLSPLCSRIAFDVLIVLIAYNFGLHKAVIAIYKHSSFPEINEIINTIESIEISLLWPVIGYFAFLIYLTFLDNIEYFLKKDKKNYSE